MCRLAAYLGPELALKQFLLDPPHSLEHQAWAPRELVYAKLNADGYGFGWYDSDDRPAIYTHTLPIWSDSNLPHLARSLYSGLWLAAVRSATSGLAVHQANTQPFADDELVFLHNGFIGDFSLGVRPLLESRLSPAIRAHIGGNTDSEFLFALLRQLLLEDPDLAMEDALGAMMEQLATWVGDGVALLNIVVTEGQRLYCVRHAINHDAPTLYYTTDDESFPEAQLLASEAMTETGFWQPVPEGHLLILDPEDPPELIRL